MSRHTVSHAEQLAWGPAYYAPYQNSKRGILFDPLTLISLGTPVVADPDRILNDSTANNEAQEVTTFLAQPDVPRNITATGTDGSNHVITLTGLDEYGQVMVETITLDGTNLVSGAKAFAALTQADVAAGATGDTFDLGVGDVLGIPYRVDEGKILMAYFDGVPDLSSDALGTIVYADTTDPAAADDGDVRGTYNPNGTLDGSSEVKLLLAIDPTSKVAAFGVNQFAG